ncbi:Metallo-dependent phosphatase [Amylostereum chailletii]|nr:Metallo-dependent phosphatase [Amylostereum chailletii]
MARAVTCGRFFRFLRSIFVPATTTFAFACLLTFFFVLYQPTRGPGDLQRLGWQAWESISVPAGSAAASGGSVDDTVAGGGGDVSAGGDGGLHDVDWWNVTTASGSSADSASLPLDAWSPLMPHDTGLSEIMVVRCMWDSRFVDMCSPAPSSDDAIKGKWVRVDRDLNRQAGMWHLYLYYRRTRRLDVPLITNIQLLPTTAPGPPPTTASSKWTKVDRSLRDGVVRTPSLFLWYETDMPAQTDKQNVITELDVIYGDGQPWYGFDKLSPATMVAGSGRVTTWLTFRRGVKPAPPAPPLHFSRDGRFKIMQVADLHFTTTAGKCRDPDTPCEGGAYNMTQSLLSRALDLEKPDLVIFTGDQLNGQKTVLDAKSVLAKFAAEVVARGIPWAAVFGNHDDEDQWVGANRREQVRLMQGLPYSLVQPGPEDIHGVGNYVLKVWSADASKTHLLTLYFLDSGAYSKGIVDWLGFVTPTEYDWIHQVSAFIVVPSINAIERPFTPDGGKDFSGIWPRDQLTPERLKLAKPNALMFFHIPLPETYGQADYDPRTGKPLDVGLGDLESSGAAKHNDGMFEKGLLRATESEHTGTGGAPEVKVVGNGHCHVTENCKRVKGVWMCFGGGGSFEGYSRVGFDRRFRIYDISDYGETIRTYKRLETGEVIDEMTLSGRGAAGANL